MRNAIPIGFLALLGVLYMIKQQPSALQPTAPKSSQKTDARAVGSTQATAPRAGAPGKRPQFNQQDMMKKIRAMMAKRRQQKALRKKLAAQKAAHPARPLASTPVTSRAPAPTPNVDRQALMKKIRAMLAQRRQQQALKQKLAAQSPKSAVATKPAAPVPARAPAPTPNIDRQALMKRIRAMLAKRRQQQAAQLAAQPKVAVAARPVVPTPPSKVNVPTNAPAPAPAVNPGAGDSASIVELQTSQGNITIKLFRKKAPITTDNFLKYVRSGHYDGTIFHRVIPNFMVQGGGMTPDMSKKPTRAPIRNEADNGLQNELGTLAMARTGYPHSASAQFFINTKNNRFLNFRAKSGRGWGYCVFGKVIKGMDVVMKISATKTSTQSGRQNVPVSPILINKAVILN